jgi:YidC/Oxa1 family membrane protein insertase
MDLGWFEIIARPLLSILRWIQGYVVNWGVAIILLTIIVRSAMFPLAFKSMTSMRKMQALSPKIKVLREKYKDNKERMNKEIMKFYGQNKVNPMGGCLPMVLQMPIFIGLYYALLPAIELRHTPFMLWWSDLSNADYTLILPILMGVSMFAQQNLTSTAATMDPTQAKIMKWMPVMMVMFFLNMPSGLVLYWVISNIISVGQQLIINKVLPAPVAAATDKVKGKGKLPEKKKKTGKAKK